MTDPAAVDRLVSKLERWKGKREARGLESIELSDAIRFLREYTAALFAAQYVHKNGESDGTQDR